MSIDSISLEIIWIRLIAIVDEASSLLERSAFSLIVREAHDFVVVLLDRDGNNLAQSSKTIPPFTLAASSAVRECLKKIHPKDLRPGDVIISNDPWISTGHQFDVMVFQPIFMKGELIGYATNITHWSDIGGRGWTIQSRDFNEEGLIIPIAKLIDEGRPNELVHDFIRENVRDPEHAFGDLRAQLAAVDILSTKVTDLLCEFGQDDLTTISSEILSRSEAAMRQAIQRLPNATYEHHMRADGIDDSLDLKVTLTVRDSSMHIDFSGSAPQSKYAINSVFNFTAGYALFAVKSVLCPEIPSNHGTSAPIEITAPSGCIVNPRRPAGLVSRHVVGHLCAEVTLGALAHLAPRSVPAGSPTTWVLSFSVLPAPGVSAATFQIFLNGGLGAFAFRDGRPCCLYPSAVQNTPIEIIEKEFPLRFEFKEFRTGSGGAGRFRGGDGQIVRMRALSPMVFTGISTSVYNAARGVHGGAAGKPGAMFIEDRPLPPRTPLEWQPGEVITLFLPGGGGFGKPEERPKELAQSESMNELLAESEFESMLEALE